MHPSPYDADAYPEGVPSPYRGQVHPYPSYEHGADYTRPVFDMTFVRQPFNVLSGVGDTGPWLPRRNRVGMPTVQPQPNPYYPHWPQVLGHTEGEHTGGIGRGMLAAAAVGATVGMLGVLSQRREPNAADWGSGLLMGVVGTAVLSFIPVYVAARG